MSTAAALPMPPNVLSTTPMDYQSHHPLPSPNQAPVPILNDVSLPVHAFLSWQRGSLDPHLRTNERGYDFRGYDVTGYDVRHGFRNPRPKIRRSAIAEREYVSNSKNRSRPFQSGENTLYDSRNESFGKLDESWSQLNENASGLVNASLANAMWSSTSPLPRHQERQKAQVIATQYIVIFSTLFFLVGTVGICGNALVIYIVLSDGKMRRSMTNILILNLALADSITILFGIPEIVMFTLDRGWQLGPVFCSLNRSAMVCALYASVLILVAVCIERYIAIVFPIKAHILCTKKRILIVIIVIWLISTLCATPTAVFNTVVRMAEDQYCITKFHANRTQHDKYFRIFKYTESSLFYVGPLIIQVICYAVIGKRLFVGLDKLHRTGGGISSASRPNGRGPARAFNEAVRARKGVVKMLMASVAIYFLSYSPHQILLVYKTFSRVSFDETWIYLVLTNTLAYFNSAANPLMYCVFSDNFRTKFKVILGTCCPCKACMCTCCNLCSSSVCRKDANTQRPITLHSYTEYTSLVRRNTQRQGQAPIVAV